MASDLMRAIVLSLSLLGAPSAQARSHCPSFHLEPTAVYGRAFGNPDQVMSVTVNVDVGPLADDVAPIFAYFEYQTRDGDFAPVYGVHVLQDGATQQARVYLARLKEGKPVLAQRALLPKTVDLILATATPAVRATRFRGPVCDALYTGGHVIQVGVAWRRLGDADVIAGEAFVPRPGTPVYQLQVLGRSLRAIALGELPESKLESMVQAAAVGTP